MTYKELAQKILGKDKELAPGSETILWGLFVYDLAEHDVDLLDDEAADREAPQDMVDYWLCRYYALGQGMDEDASHREAETRLLYPCIYTVMLKDGTVGTVESPYLEEGDVVVVSLHDENGNPIQRKGVVKEVLEERYPWN